MSGKKIPQELQPWIEAKKKEAAKARKTLKRAQRAPRKHSYRTIAKRYYFNSLHPCLGFK